MTNFSRLLIMLGISILTLLTCVVIFISAPAPAKDITTIKPITVNVIEPSPIEFTPQFSTYGRIKAQRYLTLSSKVDGEITFMHNQFEKGGTFNNNEMMLQIDTRRPTQNLIQATKHVEIAQANYELEIAQQKVAMKELEFTQKDRLQSVVTDESIRLRKPQLKKAQSDLFIAQAEVESAQLLLEQSTLTSHGHYQVLSRDFFKGDYVSQGQVVAKLADLSALIVEIAVPPAIAKQLTNSQQVMINDQFGLQVIGQVSHVVASLEENSQLQSVTVKLPNKGMILGQFVEIKLPLQRHSNIIKLPLSAVFDNRIWVVNAENILSEKRLDTVWITDQSMYVKNVLLKNDRVVSHRVYAVKEGDVVTAPSSHNKMKGQL